jgi:hypothetical protein
MSASKRVYRPFEPSDLPKIQNGTLKAFWNGIRDKYIPVTLISTKYEWSDPVAFLIHDVTGDRLCNSHNIVIDVTPEVRFAVWNIKLGRFAENGATMTSRVSAEISKDVLVRLYGAHYVVVEFEYPGESNDV